VPKVNLAGVKTSFDLIPDGLYDGMFTAFENKKIKNGNNKGGDMVAHTYVITEDGEWKGRKLFKNYPLTEAALWSWKGDAITLGADADALETEIDTDDVLATVLNNSVKLKVSSHADPNDDQKFYNDVSLVGDTSW
jgi:hypothetical protein